MELLTSSNGKVVEESTKATQALENKISEAKVKVQQLQQEVNEFMADFRNSSEKNIADMNKFIEGFLSSLKSEKQALLVHRADIKLDNIDLNVSITQQVTKLQNDLVAENKIMNVLAEQMQKTKVLDETPKNASTHIAKLE